MAGVTGEPVARRGRGRPPGRSAEQERQRKQTRDAILSAAAEIFSSKPYFQATIYDLIGAAGISRATFYDHFDSKLALAVVLYDNITDDWHTHFDKLAERDDWTRDMVKLWIRDLAELYRAHGFVTSLVEQLTICEVSFRNRLSQDRDALIRRLAGKGLASFEAAFDGTAKSAETLARMRLLLIQLDKVCGMISGNDDLAPDDEEALVDVVAGLLLSTLRVSPSQKF